MSERNRQIAFVNQQIPNLLKRHMAKLLEIRLAKTNEEILRASGNADLISAMDATDALDQEIESLIAKRYAFAAECLEKFGAVCEELIRKEEASRDELVNRTHEDFEFRIREAIGLVELVGGPEAFKVLQDCREEINKLGKE